jgi:hypothetical protein
MIYDIISSEDKNELRDLVLLAIKDGWEPQGGVCVGIGNIIMFYQAMIRRAK